MAFTLQELREAREFRRLPLHDRVSALEAYFNEATDYLSDPERPDRMSEADKDRMRTARNETVTQEIYESIAPKVHQRARLLTGSSDPEVIAAKSKDLMKKAVSEPDTEIDFTAPKNVVGSDKALQDRLLKEPEFRKKFEKGGGDGTPMAIRRGLLKRLFFTNEESVGIDIKETLSRANELAMGYQDVDSSMELGDGMKLHIRSDPDPRRRGKLNFSVDDPRLKADGKYPIRFSVTQEELKASPISKILENRAQDIKDGTEHSVFGDLQRSARAGFVGGVAIGLEGAGDLGAILLQGVGDIGKTFLGVSSSLESAADAPSLGSAESVPNIARGLQGVASGIREGESLDTKVARNIETDNLFTANRLMDLFGEGIGQLGTSMLAGGIGGLVGKGAGAAAGAFASNFAQITGESTQRAVQLGGAPSDAKVAGIVSAVLGAPLETVADVTAMKLLAGTGMKALADRGLISKVLGGATFQSLVESGTEGAQQMLANGSLKTFINDELGITDGTLESMVAGALVGIAAGGGGGFVSHFRGEKAEGLPNTKPQMDEEALDAVGEARSKEAQDILKDAKQPDAEERLAARDQEIENLDLDQMFAREFANELANAGLIDPDALTGDVDYEEVIDTALTEHSSLPEDLVEPEALPEDAEAQVAQSILETQRGEVDALIDAETLPSEEEPSAITRLREEAESTSLAAGAETRTGLRDVELPEDPAAIANLREEILQEPVGAEVLLGEVADRTQEAGRPAPIIDVEAVVEEAGRELAAIETAKEPKRVAQAIKTFLDHFGFKVENVENTSEEDYLSIGSLAGRVFRVKDDNEALSKVLQSGSRALSVMVMADPQFQDLQVTLHSEGIFSSKDNTRAVVEELISNRFNEELAKENLNLPARVVRKIKGIYDNVVKLLTGIPESVATRFEGLANDVVNEVLGGDFSRFDQEPVAGASPVNLQKVVDSDPVIAGIVERASQVPGLLLTGSATLGNQGTVNRPDQLHDVDFVIPNTDPNDFANLPDLEAMARQVFGPEAQNVTEANVFENNNGNRTHTFTGEINGRTIPIDFFVQPNERKSVDVPFTTPSGRFTIKAPKFGSVFAAKLSFARDKDILDFNAFRPYPAIEVETVVDTPFEDQSPTQLAQLSLPESATPPQVSAMAGRIAAAQRRVEETPPQTQQEFEEIAVELLSPEPRANDPDNLREPQTLEAEVIPEPELDPESIFAQPLDDEELAGLFGAPASVEYNNDQRTRFSTPFDDRVNAFLGGNGITISLDSLDRDMMSRLVGDLSTGALQGALLLERNRAASDLIGKLMAHSEDFLSLAPAMKSTDGYKALLKQMQAAGAPNPEMSAAEVMFSRLIRSGMDKGLSEAMSEKPQPRLMRGFFRAVHKLFRKVINAFRGLSAEGATDLVEARDRVVEGLFGDEKTSEAEAVLNQQILDSYQGAFDRDIRATPDGTVSGVPTAFLRKNVSPGATIFGKRIAKDGTLPLEAFVAGVRKSGLKAIEKDYISRVTPRSTPDGRVSVGIVQALANELMNREIQIVRETQRVEGSVQLVQRIRQLRSSMSHLFENTPRASDTPWRLSFNHLIDNTGQAHGFDGVLFADSPSPLELFRTAGDRLDILVTPQELADKMEQSGYDDATVEGVRDALADLYEAVRSDPISAREVVYTRDRSESALASEMFVIVNPKDPQDMPGLSEVVIDMKDTPSEFSVGSGKMRVHGVGRRTSGVMGFTRQYDAEVGDISGPFIFEVQSDMDEGAAVTNAPNLENNPEAIPGEVIDRAKLVSSGYEHMLISHAFVDADKRGKTHVIITDDDTAILTEGHHLGLSVLQENHDPAQLAKFHKRQEGMRLAYGPRQGRLHKIARRISGDKGTPVNLGAHRSFEEYGENILHKEDVTGIAYRIPENFVAENLFKGEAQGHPPTPDQMPTRSDSVRDPLRGFGREEGFPSDVQPPPGVTEPTQTPDPQPAGFRPDARFTTNPVDVGRVRRVQALVQAGILHAGEILSEAYRGALDARRAQAREELVAGLAEDREFQRRVERAARQRLPQNRESPGSFDLRPQGVVLGRGALPTDRATERQFVRQFEKLRKAFVDEVKRLQVAGETERAEILQLRVNELDQRFPASLSRRQRLAWNANLMQRRRKQKRSRRQGRPLKKISEFVESRIDDLNHEDALALTPDEFSAFIEQHVLLRPEDFTVRENPDGTLRISIGSLVLDNSAPDPAQLELRMRRIEQNIRQLRGAPVALPESATAEQIDAFVQSQEARLREADRQEQALNELRARPIQGAPGFELSSTLPAPTTTKRSGEVVTHTEQQGINQQLRQAALEWYWRSKRPNRVPVIHPADAFPADPMGQLMSAGADIFSRVADFFGVTAVDDYSDPAGQPDVTLSGEEEQTRRFNREEEELEFGEGQSAGQRMATWQARIQRLAAEGVAVYDTLAGDLLTEDPDNLNGTPIIAPELVEFAMYARMRFRNDGAPLSLTEQDARQAVSDILTIMDPALGAIYRQTFGDPEAFQEAIRSGTAPGDLEAVPSSAKLVGPAFQDWGRPDDMPLDVESSLRGLNTVHRGIMGDFWVATQRRRKQLGTDEFTPNVNDDIDVSQEERNLRAEYRNQFTVRRQAFERAKARGLRPIDVDVAPDFRDDDFEFFRNYVLEARVARESMSDLENAENVEYIADPISQDMLDSGQLGDVDLTAMSDNLGFNSLSHAFEDSQARARRTRSRDVGSMARNRANMAAAAVGPDYLEFLQRVRAGRVNGLQLARRIYVATKSPAIKSLLESLVTASRGALTNVRVALSSVDDLNGQLGGFSTSSGPMISVSETPLTSERMFSHALTEELIHAVTHGLSIEAREAVNDFHRDLMQSGNEKMRQLLRNLINMTDAGSLVVDLDTLHTRYRDGEISWSDYQVAYALSSPSEAIAHAVITPAFQSFLLENGLWDRAKGAISGAFGQQVANAARDFANEAHAAAQRPRERQAQRAADAGQPHHTPPRSRREPPNQPAFVEAWSSENPREFLRENRDKVVAGIRGDATPEERKVASEKIKALVDLLIAAPDPAPNVATMKDGEVVERESGQARRLRMAIASLFNPNLPASAAYRMATETLASSWGATAREEIRDEEGVYEVNPKTPNRQLYGSRAFIASVAKTPVGMKVAEGVRYMINRGLPGLGGGGRERSRSMHTASAKRIQEVAKGLSPKERMKAVMANQLLSTGEGLDPESERRARLDNLKSWRQSIASKVLRAPSRKLLEMGVVEEGILKEVESVATAKTADEAMQRLNEVLGGEDSRMNRYRRALIKEFETIRPEFRFVTEVARGQPWEKITHYIPIVVDNPHPSSSIYNRPADYAHDILGEALISSDGEVGVMDRVGVGTQSGSLLRRGLPGNTSHYYRSPTISMLLGALANQQYEVSTLAERMVTKALVRPQYSPDNEKLNQYFPPMVNDMRLDKDGEPMVSGNVTNAATAITAVAEKYYHADRSSMPSGDIGRAVRALMKMAYYKALVGVDQVGIQLLAVPVWLASSGTKSPVYAAQFFRNLARSFPHVGSERGMIEEFVARHASAFDTRVADANVEALTREENRIFASVKDKRIPGNVAAKVAIKVLSKAMSAGEGYATFWSNLVIGGSEKLGLRPILLTEYQARAIENGTAKGWDDNSIFQDNVDFEALDHAMRVVDEVGAPSDPADRGEAFISQGKSQANEIGKFALLSFAGHQVTMVSNAAEAGWAIKNGDFATAYRLLANVALQGAFYTAISVLLFKDLRDWGEEKVLGLFGDLAKKEQKKVSKRRQERKKEPIGQKLAGVAYVLLDDSAFPMIPVVGPFLSTPLGAFLGGIAIDGMKNDLVTGEHVEGYWAEKNIAYNADASQTKAKLSVFGAAGDLVAEMWENHYFELGAGFLQHADVLIPERTARKAALKGFRAWAELDKD